MGSVAKGLEKAEQGLQADTTTSVLDIMKALKDPDFNRAHYIRSESIKRCR